MKKIKVLIILLIVFLSYQSTAYALEVNFNEKEKTYELIFDPEKKDDIRKVIFLRFSEENEKIEHIAVLPNKNNQYIIGNFKIGKAYSVGVKVLTKSGETFLEPFIFLLIAKDTGPPYLLNYIKVKILPKSKKEENRSLIPQEYLKTKTFFI